MAEKQEQAAPQDQAVERLQNAIEQLHKDVMRVEVWAGALTAFSKPVPNYEPSDEFLLKSSENGKPLGGN